MTLLLLTVTAFFLLITLANVLFWPRVRPSLNAADASVSVLIPARNEEGNLPDCLDRVMRQGDVVAEILVCDDHSTDATSTVISDYSNRDPRIRAIPARPLPAGWIGKNFVCANLADSASGRYFLFLDADARLHDDAITSLVTEMECRRLQLLSCWPGLEMLTFVEQALMPMLNFVVFSIYPGPMSLFFSYPSLALAHGACLMIERESYREIGGHSVVRNQIFEDTRLARLWRERRLRGLCLDGHGVVSVRMYSSFAQIWLGFQKNFYPAFRSDISFWAFMLFHTTFYLGPFLLLPLSASGGLLLVVLAILLTRLLLAIRFSQPPWTVIFHPFSQVLLLLLGISSWWRCRTGQGVEWKGRSYYQN